MDMGPSSPYARYYLLVMTAGSHVADLSVSAERCAERGPRDDRCAHFISVERASLVLRAWFLVRPLVQGPWSTEPPVPRKHQVPRTKDGSYTENENCSR